MAKQKEVGFKMELTMTEMYFIVSSLRERQFSLKNDIAMCGKLKLDSTASEESLANVESAITKINEMLKEILYE